MARLGFEGFEILNDVQCSQRKMAYCCNKYFRRFKRKIRKAKNKDEDYTQFLMLLVDYVKESTNEDGNEGLAVVRNKRNRDEYEDEEENQIDPDYRTGKVRRSAKKITNKEEAADSLRTILENDSNSDSLSPKKKKKKVLMSKKKSTMANDASSKRQEKGEKKERSSKEQTVRKGRKSSAIVTVNEDVAFTVKEEIADIDEASFKSGHSLECKAAEDDLQIIVRDNCTFGKEGSSILMDASSAIHCENVEDISPLQSVDCDFVRNVKALLERPYDQKEYIGLWKDVQRRTNILKNMDLRNGKFCSTSRLGKSYLDHHKDLHEKLKEVDHDKSKKLNILRGFFFWLQNLTQEGAFKPWTNQEWLSLVDKSSVPAHTFSD